MADSPSPPDAAERSTARRRPEAITVPARNDLGIALASGPEGDDPLVHRTSAADAPGSLLSAGSSALSSAPLHQGSSSGLSELKDWEGQANGTASSSGLSSAPASANLPGGYLGTLIAAGRESGYAGGDSERQHSSPEYQDQQASRDQQEDMQGNGAAHSEVRTDAQQDAEDDPMDGSSGLAARPGGLADDPVATEPQLPVQRHGIMEDAIQHPSLELAHRASPPLAPSNAQPVAEEDYLARLSQHREAHPSERTLYTPPVTGSEAEFSINLSLSSAPVSGTSATGDFPRLTINEDGEAGRAAGSRPADGQPAPWSAAALDSGITAPEAPVYEDADAIDRSSPKRRRIEPSPPPTSAANASSPPAEPKNRKPKQVPKPRQREARSERAALAALLNARYDERGEIIEDDDVEVNLVQDPRAEASPLPQSAISGPAEAATSSPLETHSSVPPQTRADIEVTSTPAPEPVNDWTKGLSQREIEKILRNAKYNEKGEIILPTKSAPAAPKKKPDSKVAAQKMVPAVTHDNDPARLAIAPPSKSKSKAKAKAQDSRSSGSFATPEPPASKKGDKKAKVADDVRSERSSSVFTASETRAESSTAQPKKASKSTATRIVELAEGTPEPPPDEDDRLYCICKKPYSASTDDDDMIECDRCDNWFHLSCVGISPAELDLIDLYICPDCEKETTERTTRKAKCRRDGCSFARFEPLSKYCSDDCGMLHMMAVWKSRHIEPLALQHAVSRAVPVEGVAIRKGSDDATVSQRKSQGSIAWREKQDQSVKDTMQARLHRLDDRLEDLRAQQSRLDSAIAAAETLPSIPRAADNEPSKSKKSKSKAAGSGTLMDRPCGFSWMLVTGAEAGAEADFCMTSERKCKRHHKWQESRASDIEALIEVFAEQREAFKSGLV